jgi:hypothetical protein
MLHYDPQHARPISIASGVIGCQRCGKPCALDGDLIPLDEICPWCREADSPKLYKIYLKEAFVTMIMED